MWSKTAEIMKTNKQVSPYGTNQKKWKTLRKHYKKYRNYLKSKLSKKIQL